MKNMSFTKQNKFHKDNRPYADVKIISTSIATYTTKCLVDSGADYLQLPEDVAVQAGLSLQTAQIKPVKTSSGNLVNYKLLIGVKIEIEGKKITTDIMFGPPNCLCIAGRVALLSAYDIGLDLKSWLCTP